MNEYVETLNEVYQECEDDKYATLPLSAEEKKLVSEHLREAIINYFKKE